jgi:hypothetical protein
VRDEAPRRADEYTAGDLTYREQRSAALVIHDRNALSWDELDSVAAFVNPRSQVVLQSARAIQGAISSLQHPLAPAAGLFAGLSGLRYTPDPAGPFDSRGFDYVQYPAQTMSSGGDCDDLSVLYASLAEASGIRTLIIATPGHLLVGLSTGIPPQGMHLLSNDPKRFVVRDGELFVPIESTALAGGFANAWEAGAEELARFSGNPRAIRLVDVRSAWKKYPPIDLSGVQPKRVLDLDRVRESVIETSDHLEAERRASLEAQLREIDRRRTALPTAELARKRAVLLVHLGRPEGRAELESIVARSPDDAIALANLGNLHLIEGRAIEAHALHVRALEHASPATAIDIHVDAALAAFVSGDQRAFTDHVVACLEAGAKDRVESLARAGFGAGGASRGDRASEPIERFVVWVEDR